MAVTVMDISALVVLNEWAITNGHNAPIYNAQNNRVSIAGIEDAIIQGILEGASATLISEAESRASIRSIQLLNPKPANATLLQSKNWALMDAGILITQLRSKATGGADFVTLSGWVDKLGIAEKVVATTASVDDIAIIQAEADMRDLGENADELAVKIMAKGALLRTVRSKIDGFEDKLKRNLAAVNDVPGYEAVVADLVASGAVIINELGG